MNTVSKPLLVTSLCLVSQVSLAGISANVALTSDYVWRGVSQNQEDPAVQGGFDYSHESGFYAGVWGSNVNFGGASLELDLYAGWGKEFENGVSIDLGIIEFSYHGSDVAGELDFTEYYLSAGYAGFNAIYSIGDDYGDSYELSYGYDFEKFSLSAAYGNYDPFEDGDAAPGLPSDYDFFTVGVSTSFEDIGISLDYWDTNSDAEVLFGDADTDSRLILSISKEF